MSEAFFEQLILNSPYEYPARHWEFDDVGQRSRRRRRGGGLAERVGVGYGPLQRKITMTDIPLEARYYVVNGKPPQKWVMKRQQVTTGKKHHHQRSEPLRRRNRRQPGLPLELFQRVITVSLETMRIVRSLPKMEVYKQ